MALGRMVERLMVLDAVLAEPTYTWLGTEFNKRSYFMRRLRDHVKREELPRLTFGTVATARHRYFPDKLPIGISNRDEDHVFVYLVTSPVPMDFRVFLLRHAEVLRWLYRWTIRVLVPAPFASAIRLFGQAARETLATPLPPSNTEVLRSVFLERQRRRETPSVPADPQMRSLSLAYGAPRFRALFRAWQQLGDPVIWAAQSYGALQRGEGASNSSSSPTSTATSRRSSASRDLGPRTRPDRGAPARMVEDDRRDDLGSEGRPHPS